MLGGPADSIDIPTEDIADVTQKIDQAVKEPFTLTPGAENRDPQY